jgi:heptosyltransferase-3
MNIQNEIDTASSQGARATGSSPFRILIFRRGSIGDAVVSIPALNYLRQKYSDAEFYCLSNSPVMKSASPVKSVLKNSGLIDEFIDLPPGGGSMASLSKLIAVIRGLKFQAAHYLSEPSSRPALLKEMLFFKICGIPAIHGPPISSTLRLYRPAGGDLWESETARLLRSVAGEDGTEPDWSFRFTDPENEAAQILLRGLTDASGHIAFSVGAKLPDKDWGDPNWAEVLGEITRRHPKLGLIGVGAAEDHARTENLIEAWSGPRINLCGASEPRISALTMKGALFYLGHDSGPMHLAALAGTRCIPIFSARAKPGVWFPHGDGHRNFYPWNLAGKVAARAGFRTAGQSIQSIMPAEVIAACISALDNKGG